jgi:hypothetical protein
MASCISKVELIKGQAVPHLAALSPTLAPSNAIDETSYTDSLFINFSLLLIF